MWKEFAQAKDIWIGGTLERRSDFIQTELVDIEYVELPIGDRFVGYITFLGKDFGNSTYEYNVEIRGRGENWVEFKILGENTRWRLTRPQNSAQPVVDQFSSVEKDSFVTTPAK